MTADMTAGAVVAERRVDIGAVYSEHLRLLVGTAISRYRIPETEAQGLAHDVFVAYLIKVEEIFDSRAWLLSAMCNASKYFLRTQSRHVALSEAIVDEPGPNFERVSDALRDRIAVRQAFCCLTARCQLALRLRYLEGYTVPEIAAELSTTPKYATKLVGRCLRQAHDRYAGGVA